MSKTDIKTDKVEFIPEFLYRRKKQVETVLAEYERQAAALNKAIKAAEELLSRNLTPEEMKSISKGKADFVMQEIEDKFQFPKADRTFNLTALGLDPKPWQIAEREARTSAEYVYTLEGGEYKTLDAYKKNLASRFDIYTTNEKQNEALKLATDLLELIEKMKENGYTFGMLPTLMGSKPLISMDGQERIPSFQTIQKL